MLKVRGAGRCSAVLARLLAVLAVLAVLVGCGPALELGSSAGPSKDEVCERFMDQGMRTETATVRPGEPAQDNHVPSTAQQYLETADGLAELGRFASDAEDREVAARGERLERQARAVLTDLSPHAGDDEARRVADPMFTESIGLYHDCVAHILEQAPAPEPSTAGAAGACEQPGAPTLGGPNVVHYGSGGHDFIESTCELREGVPVDDGCSFPGYGTTLSGDGGDQAHASVEVAYDPDTCQALYESGPVRPGTLP